MRKRMRNGYGDKMHHNEFFASFLRFCVFDLCYFVMDATLIIQQFQLKSTH
jgi:hypothetical protein